MPQSRAQAIAQVDRHVSPRNCFVWFMDSRRGWEPIQGTGCAHYVAHQIGRNTGRRGSNGCNDNYLIRVPDLVRGMTQVAAADVAAGDVWANAGLDHCGIVSTVTTDERTGQVNIDITHCSSRQGGVVTNDWRTHFRGGGNFYRP